MKRIFTIFIVVILLLLAGLPANPIHASNRNSALGISRNGSESTPSLAKVANSVWQELGAKSDGKARVIVVLAHQTDLNPYNNKGFPVYSRQAQRLAVYNALIETAQEGQRSLLFDLHAKSPAAKLEDIHNYWIFNGFAASADRKALDALSSSPQVAYVYADEIIQLPPSELGQYGAVDNTLPLWGIAVEPSPTPQDETISWGLRQIGADAVWNQLGYRGEGVVVGTIDSGVFWEHPALKAKYRGWDGSQADHKYSWYDILNNQPVPYDDQGHGTHTMGSMVGSTDTGKKVGVAPGAKWIAVKALDSNGSGMSSDLLKGMEWMMAPGGNPNMAPDVVSDSWGARSCEELFRQAVKSWRAAGIVPVFSAGNNGTMGSSTIGSPACYPESIAVGATEQNDRVADFSSQGPSTYEQIKPDICAPGVRITSSMNNGAYGEKSGTSMATPYLGGVVALMLSANPDLSIDEIIQALKDTALDLGDKGADNLYGWGRVDALAAVQSILPLTPTPVDPLTATATPSSAEPSSTPTDVITFTPSATQGTPVPAEPTQGMTITPAPTFGTPVSPTTTPGKTVTSVPTEQLPITPAPTYGTPLPQVPTEEVPIIATPQVPFTPTPQHTTFPLFNPTQAATLPPQVSPVDSGMRVYDDMDKAIAYDGGWQVLENPNLSGGKQHASDMPGSMLQFTFTGDQIVLLNTRAPIYGMLYALLDDEFLGFVNLYAPTLVWQQKWTSRPFQNGTHTLKLVYYSGGAVNLDAILVRQTTNGLTAKATQFEWENKKP
ncbi:MAG: S8 family serine peptidase [Chloroflexota bacterium]